MMNEFNSMIMDIIDALKKMIQRLLKNISKKIKKLNKYNEMAGKSIIRFFDKYNRENLMYFIINHKGK